MSRLIRLTLLALALGLVPQRANAQDGDTLDLSDVIERPEFWDFETEEEAEYRGLMRQGEELLRRANEEQAGDTVASRETADLALLAFEQASELRPNRFEPRARAALVMERFHTEPVAPPPSQLTRAIKNLDALEKLVPEHPSWPTWYSQRAILHTKRGKPENIRQAIADYDNANARLDTQAPGWSVAQNLGNQAEAFMMLGRLEESIAVYERALESGGEISVAYGLAVALDRHGQGHRARQVAGRFAPLDDNDEALKHSFFVPRGEGHYYRAMRHEGRGELELAIERYTLFLTSLPTSPWAKRARENVAALKKRVGKRRSPKPLHTRGF